MRVISWFGYTPQSVMLSIIFIVMLFFLKLKQEAIITTVFLFINFELSSVLKIFFQRIRPSVDIFRVDENLISFAYPSGHVMFYTVLFGFFLFFSDKFPFSKIVKILFSYLAFFLILLVGISRMYLGLHWLSDVIGGYFAGSIVLFLGIKIYWNTSNFSIKKEWNPR